MWITSKFRCITARIAHVWACPRLYRSCAAVPQLRGVLARYAQRLVAQSPTKARKQHHQIHCVRPAMRVPFRAKWRPCISSDERGTNATAALAANRSRAHDILWASRDVHRPLPLLVMRRPRNNKPEHTGIHGTSCADVYAVKRAQNEVQTQYWQNLSPVVQKSRLSASLYVPEGHERLHPYPRTKGRETIHGRKV